MAMDLRQSDYRALLMKIQAAAGTAQTLAAATDSFLVLNAEHSFSTEEVEREVDKPGHGARPFVPVGKRNTHNFDIELRGAATVGTAAPIAPILRACGFGETLTASASAVYAPVTSGFELATVAAYHAGTVYNTVDARGVISQLMFDIKNFAKAKVQLMGTGTATPVADASIPAGVDLSRFRAPVPIETETFEVDIGGKKLNTVSVALDTQATVNIYEGSESRFGFLQNFYRPTGTLRCFKEQRSNFHPENLHLASTVQAAYLEIVGGGEKLRVDMPKIQLGNAKHVDIDGIAGWEIPFKCIAPFTLSFLAP